MKNMTLVQIAKACKGTLCQADEVCEKEAGGVVIDSRLLEEGDVFIATKGEKVDGHSFIGQVYSKGALCVICEKMPEATMKKPHILVEDTFQALKDLAQYYRSTLSIPIIGVTGSVGKTSTKEMIAQVLKKKYHVLKTEGNFNNEIGLPLTLLRIREYHEVAVVEMGISDFEEMHRLSKMARPDICVITNIGQCHLENLKSRDGILKAKTEIFDFMNQDGIVFLNGDDDKLISVKEVHGKAPVFFGMEESNNVYATDVESQGLFGTRMKIHKGEECFDVEIPLPGTHMVWNVLAAYCVASYLGLSSDEIAKGIGQSKSVDGRSNIIRTGDYTIIDDCYNANPISMKAAIDLLVTSNTRKVAILGDMYELGTDTGCLHQGVGEYAAKKGLDLCICIGENGKYIYDGALENWDRSFDLRYFATKQEFMESGTELLKKGDTILIKASHAMAFEELVEFLKN